MTTTSCAIKGSRAMEARYATPDTANDAQHEYAKK